MIATSDFLVSLICLVHFEFGNSLDFRVAFAPIAWKISSKSFGNEFAQVVILPAPRHITRSPGSATAATCEGSSCSSLRGALDNIYEVEFLQLSDLCQNCL